MITYTIRLLIKIRLYYLICLIHNVYKIDSLIISITLFHILSFSNFASNSIISSIINFLFLFKSYNNSRLLYSIASICISSIFFIYLLLSFLYIFFSVSFLISINSISPSISSVPKNLFLLF